MSSKTWYALQLKAIPSRYGLSKNVQTLLRTLDWVHDGSVDGAELGRLVRLSPQRRAAVANTISKCAGMIKKQPEELKTCVDIIEMCTEILEIADRPPLGDGFPFMKLPISIRDMVLERIVEQEAKATSIVPVNKANSCNCPRLERGAGAGRALSLPYTFGPALYDEFFRVFFRKKKIRFRCTCELYKHLNGNQRLVEHMQSVIIHWCGPLSARAFKMLAKCSRLETLALTISKSTLSHLTERAEAMKEFFPVPYRSIRMTDALGLDDLLKVRGLQDIVVHRAEARPRDVPSETDRANLRDLLCSKLMEPKIGDF